MNDDPTLQLRKQGFIRLFLIFFCLTLVITLFSCNSNPIPAETPLPAELPGASRPPSQAAPPTAGAGGIVEEIRSHTERGIPSSLLRALDIIGSRNLASTEFGRVMTAVNVTLLRTLYPSIHADLPPLDPPLTHIYARILREAERGVYTPVQPNSTDYLEHVLPFLSLYGLYPGARNTVPEQFLSALPDLERGSRLNRESFLAGYFIGIVYEHSGRLEAALTQFTGYLEQFPECYPAALGIARVMDAQGRQREASEYLQDLVIRFPDNHQVKRQLALAYYQAGDWSRAETAVAEILQRSNRDGEFVLMRAHIFVEQGQFLQAQTPLDIYATINPGNRLYLFLRARVQAEGFNNRDAALNYLRSILRNSPSAAGGNSDDSNLWSAAAVYAARLLMASPRPADQSEGRELLTRLMAVPPPSLEVIALALDEAIRREAWTEARTHMTRLLNERRSSGDLLAAYTVERAQGNNAAALAFARELHERDRFNEEGNIAYISALIDTGRRDEAARLIEGRLSGMPGGPLRSRYFFLRSRTRGTEESMMSDLRASLFEDPRNLDALIAMFEIYHRRRDERRAVYYLRQALALAPDNPRLRRHEAEYAAAMGGTF